MTKENFLDREIVIRALGKGRAKAMSKGLSYVRKVGKNSMKYKASPASSRPGEPPVVRRNEGFTRSYVVKKTGETKTRATSPLKELVYFSYDWKTKTGVAGPAVFKATKTRGYRVAEALEKGQTIPKWIPGYVMSYLTGQTGWQPGRMTTIRIRPRPTMQLALLKSQQVIAAAWKAAMNTG